MEAPKLPSFFKSKGPRAFNYKPWYYDAAKEERAKRNRLILDSQKNTDENREVFKSTLHEKWRSTHSGGRQRSRSNMRLIFIITLLVLISYYLLK